MSENINKPSQSVLDVFDSGLDKARANKKGLIAFGKLDKQSSEYLESITGPANSRTSSRDRNLGKAAAIVREDSLSERPESVILGVTSEVEAYQKARRDYAFEVDLAAERGGWDQDKKDLVMADWDRKNPAP